MARISTRRQPTGLVSLPSGNSLADKFWLPIGNHLFAAHSNSVILRSTGTAPIVSAYQGNGLKGDGLTYFVIPTLTLTAPYSISVFTSAPASGNAAMAVGDHTSTANFLWVNDGTTARWRINSGDVSFANSNYTTPGIYTLTCDASGNLKIYKDGKFLTSSFNGTPTFVLKSIGTGYSSASFNMSGGTIFGVQVNTKKALSADEVKQVADNFWDPLQQASTREIGLQIAKVFANTDVACTTASPNGVTGNFAGVFSPTLVNATTAKTSDTGNFAGVTAGSITITSNVTKPWKLTNVATLTGDIPISLTYIGSPTAIKARFNGGSWQTIIASPSGGVGSGTLTGQATGEGLLEVQFSNDASVFTNVPGVSVRLMIATGGQSNHVGHNDAYGLYPTHATLVPVELCLDGVWRTFQDSASEPYHNTARTPNTAIAGAGTGTYFGALATKLMAKGISVGFVPVAVGSTTMLDWQPGADHFNVAQLYGSMTSRIVAAGGVNFMLWLQGESDSNTTFDTYVTQAKNVYQSIWTDTATKLIISVPNSQGGWLGTPSNLYPVQQAIRYMTATLPNVMPGAELDGAWTTGGVHYSTAAMAQTVADRTFNVISAQLLGGTVVTCGTAGVGTPGVNALVNVTVVNAGTAGVNAGGFVAQVASPTTVAASTAQAYSVGRPAVVASNTTFTATTAGVGSRGVYAAIANATTFTTTFGSDLVSGVSASVSLATNIQAVTAQLGLAGIFSTVGSGTTVNAVTAGSSVFGLAAQVGSATTVQALTAGSAVFAPAALVGSSTVVNATTAGNLSSGVGAVVGFGVTVSATTAQVGAYGKPAAMPSATVVTALTGQVGSSGVRCTVSNGGVVDSVPDVRIYEVPAVNRTLIVRPR